MVVKIQPTTIPQQYIFNVAGAAFLALTVALAIRSSFVASYTPSCVLEASTSSGLALRHASGALLEASELANRVEGGGIGIPDRVAIVEADHGRQATAMRVRFARLNPETVEARRQASGVHFLWRASLLDRERTGCLGYRIQLPADFRTHVSGSLPGLEIRPAAGQSSRSAPETITVPIYWEPDGDISVRVSQRTGDSRQDRRFRLNASSTRPRLATVRWVDVALQVTLNTPGASDGSVRVWLDGALKLEQTGVKFYDAETMPERWWVDARVTFVDETGAWVSAPNDSSIELSDIAVHR
ncbi:MAG: polysaccharide lyase [Hyphomicrobiaceae bacterium]